MHGLTNIASCFCKICDEQVVWKSIKDTHTPTSTHILTKYTILIFDEKYVNKHEKYNKQKNTFTDIRLKNK